MPVFKVCSLLRMSPRCWTPSFLGDFFFPALAVAAILVPSAQRAGEMLHPELRSMLLHGKVGRVLCSSHVLPAPSSSSPCASCTFLFYFNFFFFNLMAKEKQPFFLGMGDLKRDISFHVQFLSLSLYIYDTHTHTYIFFFFSVGWSFIQTTCVSSAVFDNVCFASTCFVVMQSCCSFISK